MQSSADTQTLKLELGTGPYRRVHKNLQVLPSKIAGKGLHVINEMIPKGTVVFKNGVEVIPRYTWEQIEKFTPEERAIFNNFCYQVTEDLYEGPRTEAEADSDVMYHWNHSCDPNSLILDDDLAIASRDIQVGEELTIDYSTFEGENTFKVRGIGNCICGAKDCRGKITHEDYKDKKFREKYFPHFESHILKKIEVYLNEQEKKEN